MTTATPATASTALTISETFSEALAHIDTLGTDLRQRGARLLRDLRAMRQAINAAIVTAACEAPHAAIRVAPLTTLPSAMREASALLTLPAVLAGVNGILVQLTGADCFADPTCGEIVVGAEALAALVGAANALDDALVVAQAERPRRLMTLTPATMDTSMDSYVSALEGVARAIDQASKASARAQQLADDLARLPRMLRIALGSLPHAATA